MTTSTHTKTQFVVCVDNRDYQASLELHKIYRTMPDEDAQADGDIRKCLDCCCGQKTAVKECPCTGCSLWPYRLGKRPSGKPRAPRILSPEHKKRFMEGTARALALKRQKAQQGKDRP